MKKNGFPVPPRYSSVGPTRYTAVRNTVYARVYLFVYCRPTFNGAAERGTPGYTVRPYANECVESYSCSVFMTLYVPARLLSPIRTWYQVLLPVVHSVRILIKTLKIVSKYSLPIASRPGHGPRSAPPPNCIGPTIIILLPVVKYLTYAFAGPSLLPITYIIFPCCA